MKTNELLEQFQRRRSPEELAAEKAQPDYWKKVARKELNGILSKFGATSRETADNRNAPDAILQFDRSVSVLVSGDDSLTLHRDKRAFALIPAIAKWLHGYTQNGYQVKAFYYQTVSSKIFRADSTADEIQEVLKDHARVEAVTRWLRTATANGEKRPVRFDLHFTIIKSPLE